MIQTPWFSCHSSQYSKNLQPGILTAQARNHFLITHCSYPKILLEVLEPFPIAFWTLIHFVSWCLSPCYHSVSKHLQPGIIRYFLITHCWYPKVLPWMLNVQRIPQTICYCIFFKRCSISTSWWLSHHHCKHRFQCQARYLRCMRRGDGQDSIFFDWKEWEQEMQIKEERFETRGS